MNPSEFGSLASDACTLDAEGSYGPDRISRTTYDAAGQVTKLETGVGVTGVAADEVIATYTNNGQVETVTDANGNRTTYVYDGFDRLNRTLMPSPSTAGTSSTTDYEELGYDAAGNVVSRRLRDATSIGFTYDTLNRLVEKDPPGSEATVTYTYDLLGRLTSAATSAQTLTFAFDALGRNTGQTGPHGTVSYVYDLAGRRTQMSYADSGLVVGYTHHVTGEITQIRENPAGSDTLLGSYAYDDLGRRTSLTRGNGMVTTYAYDNVSRLTQLTHNLNGTANDLTLDFTLSPAGEIATNTRSNDAFSFTALANGSVASTINGLNQVTAQGGLSVSHDARGNVSAIGSASYGYDSENRLTSAPSSVAFGFDPAGRLYYSTGNPQLTRFAYDGGSLIAEYDYGMGLLRRYVNGPGVDEPLVWYEGTGTSTRRYFHADERGSVIAVSDGSGNLVGSTPNRYDEYGVAQGTLAGRFGYTGQMWLPEVSLYHYRARAYNPAMGRFMQTDPIGYGSGMNLYAYVRNNPVNFTDPMGWKEEDECHEFNCPVVTGSRCPRGLTCYYGEFDFFLIDIGSGVNPGEPACPAPHGARYNDRLAAILGGARAARAEQGARPAPRTGVRDHGDNRERSFSIEPVRGGGWTFSRFRVGNSGRVDIAAGSRSGGAGHVHVFEGGNTLSTGFNFGRFSTDRGDVVRTNELLDHLEGLGVDVSDFYIFLVGENGNVVVWIGRDFRTGAGTVIGTDQCP